MLFPPRYSLYRAGCDLCKSLSKERENFGTPLFLVEVCKQTSAEHVLIHRRCLWCGHVKERLILLEDYTKDIFVRPFGMPDERATSSLEEFRKFRPIEAPKHPFRRKES